MYPPAFKYAAPETLEEALSILGEHGEARVLAGGQSLIPMMKARLASPAMLVDINGISGLDSIQEANGQVHVGGYAEGHVRVGPLARHNDIINSSLVSGANSAMASAAPWIADPLVRNRGTLCGSVAHCDPEGDWNSVMLATRATVIAASSSGERRIAIDDFIVDFFTNSLQPGEMIAAIEVPKDSGMSGGAYLKLERKIGDYATVGVATHLALEGGRIISAGIALTSVNTVNTRAGAAEQALVGQEPSEELFAEAGRLAAEAADPDDDVRGSADWKRHVVDVYARRGLAESLAKAQGS